MPGPRASKQPTASVKECLSQRKPLEDRQGTINQRLPHERYRRMSQSVMQRYTMSTGTDSDSDEQENVQSYTQQRPADVNKDGKITVGELTRMVMSQRSPPDSAAEYPTEEWDRLFAELASVESGIERLTQTIRRCGRIGVVPEILQGKRGSDRLCAAAKPRRRNVSFRFNPCRRFDEQSPSNKCRMLRLSRRISVASGPG